MNTNNNRESQDVRLVNKVLYQTANIIKNNYSLSPIGSGATMPDGPIRELYLAFNSYESLSMPELRKLLFQISNELINQVNSNEEIQPFLYKKPFNQENVQIIIFNYDKKGRNLCDPEITTAEISHGFLTYGYRDPTHDYRLIDKHKETYAEALKELDD